MRDHRVAIHGSATAGELGELFDARPATWLRPFLALSVNPHGGAVHAPAWFRLGPRRFDEERATASWSLTWRPRRGPRCFELLLGGFQLDGHGPEGCTFALEAAVRGGDPARTEESLRALLQLIDGAVTVDQAVG